MKKWLIKMLMPSAEDMTKMAVETIARGINDSGKAEIIAKYGTYADEFSKVQAKVTGWLRDGKIDGQEQKELYDALLPLAERIVKEVCG